MRRAVGAQALGMALLLCGPAIGAGDDPTDRAEAAAVRAEDAARRSEDAARRVEAAADRLERIVDKLSKQPASAGRHGEPAR